MKRRTFVKHAAAASPILTVPVNWVKDLIEDKTLTSIGLQLFSMPQFLQKNLEQGVKMIASMGYDEIELFGPYPFSVTAAKESWAEVTRPFGGIQSGYFRQSQKEFKRLIQAHKLKITSMHTDLQSLEEKMDELCDAANDLGVSYLVLPAIPVERRKSLDDYKRMATTFNTIGEEAKKRGVRFAYHNHGYGWVKKNGLRPIDIIFNETDPSSVFFEMDIFWTAAAGVDIIDCLNKHPNRYHLMHLKDMKETVRFQKNGEDSREWFSLLPAITSCGDGVLNLKEIVKTAKKMGVKRFFVEQDIAPQPKLSLQQSHHFLDRI